MAETTTEVVAPEKEKQYVLISATYGRTGERLHWVVAEKQKRDDWFLKGRPASSLCGIHATQIVEHESEIKGSRPKYDENWNRLNKENKNFFLYYPEEEYVSDLQTQLYYGGIRNYRMVWNPNATYEVMGKVYTGKYERVPVTIELLKSEMWCKQCQRKKAELYPNL